jgi:hypothetical protein
MQAGESLGQGIQSAAGSVADVMKQKNAQAQQDKQRKQAFGLLQQFGLVKQNQPTNDDLADGLKDYGSKMGVEVNVNHGDNPEQEKKNMVGIYKALGIPLPKGKIDVMPGTTVDFGGGASYTAPKQEKSVAQQVAEYQAAEKSLQGTNAIPTVDSKGGLKISSPTGAGSGDKKENVKLIADAIQNDDQLADFGSLYGLAGPVKAELEKRNVNVNQMQLNALSEKKLAQTLNGPQQVRLRQSIASVNDGLDILDNLNNEFKRSGIKAFNKAQIESLANGAGTKEQQELAQQFKTQIIGLQDEFGNVIMSGNSPTDRALELSGKVFGEDYNDTSISSAIKQMKVLLKTRSNAIENVEAAMTGGNGQGSSQSTLQAAGMSSQPQQQSKYTLVQ